MRQGTIRHTVLTGLIIGMASVLIAWTPSFAASCSHVDLPSDTVLPGGAEVGAGRLTVCRQPDYSPSFARHLVRWNGMPISQIMSRRGHSETSTIVAPFFTFGRDLAGRLHLIGFATPGGRGMDTFRPMPISRGNQPVQPITNVTTEEVLLTAVRD